MSHFFNHNPTTLKTFCRKVDMPDFTATQLLDWVYAKGVTDPNAMTNIAKRHRNVLTERMTFLRGRRCAHQTATDGTEKLLLDWNEETPRAGLFSPRVTQTHMTDGVGNDSARLPVLKDEDSSDSQIECVMIPTDTRRTACVSSQIGCPVGCRFCASGLGGLDGNLTAGQIVEQVYRLNRVLCRDPIGRITNVVFMGMGEPLANYRAVTDAIRTLNGSWGMGIGARRITISTVGLPGAIRKLVEFDLPVTLALSLHAPNDDLRRRIIPWAQYAPIAELIDACDEYFQISGREITFEYILLGGFNDAPEHAQELATHANRLRANVNLIRYNEVAGLPFARPETGNVRRFQEVLRKRNVNVHIRASRGRDIAAACGQLRHEQRGKS